MYIVDEGALPPLIALLRSQDENIQEQSCGTIWSSTLHPTPSTLHPQPYTLNPEPYTLNPEPHTLHPAPYTLHPTL